MKKILIVEDDESLLNLYEEILTEAGYRIEKVTDGLSGRKRIDNDKPDLLLLDIMLPKLNGLDLLEEIRANPDTKDLKVIIVTNLSSEEDRNRAQKLGVEKYMIKTEYDPNQIVEIIKDILKP